MIRRLIALPALTLLALVGLASAASAHVNIDPEEVTGGSTTTVTLSFHHGKDGAATTGLEVLLPDGVTLVDVPEVEGWTSAVDETAGTVTWSGGSVADGEEGAFPVEVAIPNEDGELLFKTIQSTEAGDLAWIEEEEGHEEGSYPAPRLTVVADPSAPGGDDGTTSSTEDEAETTTTERRLPGTTLEAEQRDDGSSSLAPWLIGAGVAAVVAIGVGGYVLKRRAG